MNAIRVETTVDEATARVVPALRPLLGKQVELIALEAEVRPSAGPASLSVDDLLAHRVDAPPGTKPLSQNDIDCAIALGSFGARPLTPKSFRASGSVRRHPQPSKTQS